MNPEKQLDLTPTSGINRPVEEIFVLLYSELKNLAALKLSLERRDHTLQATALVHEAFLKLEAQEKVFENRQQFVATVSEAMRRILVDHARRRLAKKRGEGAEHESLQEETLHLAQQPERVLEVDEALTELRRFDPQSALLVELKFFGGFSMIEIAQMLDISLSKAEKMWGATRIWLYDHLR